MDVLRQLRHLLSRENMIGFDSEINLMKLTSKFTPARKILGLMRGMFQRIHRENHIECSRLTSVS